MIDTLLAFGCSHTYGDEAISDYNIGIKKEENIYASYPYFLSQHLNCEHYYNYSICGGSNQEISSSLFEKILIHKKEIDEKRVFIVIGWTTNNRIKVTSHTPSSYCSLINTINNLPLIDRLKYYTKNSKNLQPKHTGYTITVVHGIVKLVYNIMLGMPVTKPSELYRSFNRDFYKSKIENQFSTDFITGIEKHIFNTESNDDTNFFIKLCVDQYLVSNNIPYISFPTFKNTLNSKEVLLSKKNNLSPADFSLDSQCFIKHYGNKYGVSCSGAHIKLPAHKKLAEFLYNTIKDRNIIQGDK